MKKIEIISAQQFFESTENEEDRDNQCTAILLKALKVKEKQIISALQLATVRIKDVVYPVVRKPA